MFSVSLNKGSGFAQKVSKVVNEAAMKDSKFEITERKVDDRNRGYRHFCIKSRKVLISSFLGKSNALFWQECVATITKKLKELNVEKASEKGVITLVLGKPATTGAISATISIRYYKYALIKWEGSDFFKDIYREVATMDLLMCLFRKVPCSSNWSATNNGSAPPSSKAGGGDKFHIWNSFCELYPIFCGLYEFCPGNEKSYEIFISTLRGCIEKSELLLSCSPHGIAEVPGVTEVKNAMTDIVSGNPVSSSSAFCNNGNNADGHEVADPVAQKAYPAEQTTSRGNAISRERGDDSSSPGTSIKGVTSSAGEAIKKEEGRGARVTVVKALSAPIKGSFKFTGRGDANTAGTSGAKQITGNLYRSINIPQFLKTAISAICSKTIGIGRNASKVDQGRSNVTSGSQGLSGREPLFIRGRAGCKKEGGKPSSSFAGGVRSRKASWRVILFDPYIIITMVLAIAEVGMAATINLWGKQDKLVSLIALGVALVTTLAALCYGLYSNMQEAKRESTLPAPQCSSPLWCR